MTETKFTRGPWQVESRFIGPLVITADGVDVAHVGADTLEQARANAHLIAAAPDLYEALEAMVTRLKEFERDHNFAPNPGRDYCLDETARAVAALAKARGEP